MPSFLQVMQLRSRHCPRPQSSWGVLLQTRASLPPDPMDSILLPAHGVFLFQ